MNEPETARAIKHVQAAVEQLGEHFDCVQVLVSSCDCDGTWNYSLGGGNFYARIGMAEAFVNQDRASDQARYIAHEMKE